jgi:predicted lipoprotein with Yx(FWY)xxD motif
MPPLFRRALTAAVLMGLAIGHADAAGPPSTAQTAKGEVLVDAKGMTLYIFDKDTGGKSACNGKCAENWPPLKADADGQPQANYSIVTREDGTKQWAYKGRPLYTWVKDAKPGDTTGDGVRNVWHVAKP